MNSVQPVLFAVGTNHRTAPIEIRERIYIREDETAELLRELRKTLSEVVVLSTCNRTEIYGVTDRFDLGLDHYKDLLIDFKGAVNEVRRDHFFGAVSCAACQQLFKVTTSLDSKIIGDMQILGQVRNAYSLATKHGSTGKVINQLFQRSFKVGKRARTDTRLHKGAITVSVAAADLIQSHFDSVAEKAVLIIGAGDTAKLAAEALIKRRVGRLLIANRTFLHAEQLAASLNHDKVSVIEIDRLSEAIDLADVVIATIAATEAIINVSDLEHCSGEKLILDLGVPRNVSPDVGRLPNVILKNLDELDEIVSRNFEQRLSNVPQTRRIVQDEMTEFLIWYYSLPLLPVNMEAGRKPDALLKREIIGTKEFLFNNLSWVHKAAMGDGADTFEGHAEVIQKLVSMREMSELSR